ncbi:MAG: hypothetical protein C0623_00720 [Desulfuromonas sp.]|nr:MAG: hypothetical protein C0623_00720 [Desulfuromonas sp.]
MIGLKRYFEHTSWMLAEKILRLGIVFFVGIYVARYLGPEKYGILNFAVAFVALFASFADLGLNNILVRELLHKKTLSEKLIGTSFLLKIAGAGFVLLLIIILTIFTSFGRQTEIVILIICVGLVFQAFNVVELFFQSKVQAKYPVFARVFSVVLANIVKILLILFKAPLVYFAFAISLEYFLLSVSLVYVYYRQKYSVFNWHFDRSIGFDLIRESWPLILSGVAVSVYIRIDQVMIKSMLGDEATGIYSVAVNLSEAWYFIPMTLTAALYPALVNAKKMTKRFTISASKNFFFSWSG